MFTGVLYEHYMRMMPTHTALTHRRTDLIKKCSFLIKQTNEKRSGTHAYVQLTNSMVAYDAHRCTIPIHRTRKKIRGAFGVYNKQVVGRCRLTMQCKADIPLSTPKYSILHRTTIPPYYVVGYLPPLYTARTTPGTPH